MQLNDRTYTRAELERYVGNTAQLGGTRHYELSDGRTRGVRAIDFDLGSGLRFTVLPDRGLDISLASFKGTNLVYQGAVGEVHPAYYDDRGLAWLRSFFAGLLTTCGLTYFGPPTNDGGTELGLHGRYSSTPASRVADLSGWEGDEYVLRVRGVVEEAAIYHDKLRLTRTITSRVGTRTLRIEDEVENFGYHSTPFTILYHFNLGFPLLDADATLHVTAAGCEPRDEAGRAGLATHRVFEAPVPNYAEQVFTHKPVASDGGRATAALVNRRVGEGLALSLSFNPAELPFLTQWKMMGAGDYVLGIEPCNAPVLARDVLRERGLLQMLEPGEKRSMTLDLAIAEGSSEIDALIARLGG